MQLNSVKTVIIGMSIYTHQFVLPKLVHQMDTEIVESAVMMSPACHNAIADYEHHTLIIEYCDRDSLIDIERLLDAAGYPVAHSKTVH